ncbi:MAG: hypothetical protein HLUCCA01_12270 [Bacteroidetes bacterium HLUCCA01]|nr:MAG: hypothetical protein HLUCCA01_12270 [Bacteroidetes bacterium HLUCCA01]
MKSSLKAALWSAVILFSAEATLVAQSSVSTRWWSADTETYGLLHRPVRVSLVPGLSTNGTDATRYSARYSLNLIAGYHGGLEDGYEIGLININKYYTYARFQLGGVNVSGGDMAGVNLGFIGNYAHKDLFGIQLAGGLNLTPGESGGLQLAGLANMAGGDLGGMHYAGLMNISGGEIGGLQLAGVFNGSRGEMGGVQLAGIGNFSGADMGGLQLAGIGNIAVGDAGGLQVTGLFASAGRDLGGLIVTGGVVLAGSDAAGMMISGLGTVAGNGIEGMAVSGIGNLASGNISGLAVSGIGNAANELEGLIVAGIGNVGQDISGLSVAGLFNVSYAATGLQVAPFNVARHFEGMPVGLISLYGNGRKNIDIWGDELGFVSAGLKTGTIANHNLLSFGFNPAITDRDVFQLAWHVGRIKTLDEAWNRPSLDRYFVKRDWSFTVLIDGDRDLVDRNHLIRYRYLLGVQPAAGFGLYGGPVLTMYVSDHPERDDFTPYTIYETSRGDVDYRFWVGLTMGVQLF